MDRISREQLLNAMFTQSLDACFFMMLDEPVHWDDALDKDAVLDYVLAHQRVTMGNPAFYAQHHVEPQELNGLTPLDFYSDIDEPRRVWRQFLDSGFLHRVTQLRRLDGSVMWLEGDYLWLKDESGAYIGSFCIQRDITDRHEAERALRATEARFTALFHQSHDGVLFLSLSGRYIAANQRAADMLGYTVDELCSLSYLNTSAEQMASDQLFQRLLAGEKLPIFKRQMIKKNGEQFPAEVNVELVRDGDGNPVYIQSLVRDISLRESLQVEAERRAARAEALNRVIDACISSDALEPLFQTALSELKHVMGIDGGAIWTDSVLVIHDLPPELELTCDMLRLRRLPLNKCFMVEDWSEYAKSDPILAEMRQTLLHLKTRATLLVTLTSGDKDIGGIVLAYSEPHIWLPEEIALAEDVGRQLGIAAERIRLQQALNASQERYRVLSEMITDYACVVRVHRDETIHLEWERSGRLSEITGYSRDELMAMGGPLSIIVPEDRPKAKLNWSPDMPVEDVEFRILRKDGQIGWLRRVSQGEMSQELNVIGRLYETLSDITARKQLEEKALALSFENERAQILGKFIRDASHEFRTPLSIINLNVYALQRLCQDEKQIKRLKTVAGQVHAIDELVDSLLILTNLDSGKELPLTPININVVLAAEFDALRSHTDGKKLDYEVVLYPLLPAVAGNVDYLSIAIRKLLDNAIRYTSAGQVTVRTFLDGAFVVIEVNDSGIGMSAETQARIFERFFRLDDAHSESGFGLGLPIAQRIVEHHRGFISVASQLGKGSSLRIHLPVG